jgi:hypothetical protein
VAEDSASSESLTPANEGDVGEWLSLIDEARKDARDYHKKCERIRKKYKYESSLTTKRRRFQLLWSNQEILKPAVYAKRPSPSVSNRWKDGDPVARITSELVERNLDFQFDAMDYDLPLRQMRDDYLLFARGVVRMRYEPVFKSAEVDPENDGFSAAKPEGDSGPGGGDDGSELSATSGAAKDADGPGTADDASDEGDEETLDFENVPLDFVHLEDFIHPKSRTWQELPWISFTSYMSREALRKRFTDKGADGKTIGDLVALDVVDGGEDRAKKTSTGINARKATVYEIWDKTRKRVVWVSPGYPEILDECAPYLKLEGFFPCPRPAYGTLSTDSLEPIPDYVFYQDQAEEIDQLTSRIGALADSLKLVGFYPAGPAGEGSPEIEMAVRPGFENKMIAVKSWAAFTQGGKAAAPIIWLPVQEVGDILKGCVELRKQLIDDVYQLTGISDIIRGTTEAEETAAAQGLKSQWGSLRLKERQNELARVGRDVTRMAAEILANHCQVTTMVKVANMKIPTEAEQQQQIQQYQVQLRQFVIQQHQQNMQQLAPGASPTGAPTPGGPVGAPQPGANNTPPGPPGATQQHPVQTGAPSGAPFSSGVAPMQGQPQQGGLPPSQSGGASGGPPQPQPPTPHPTQEMIQELLKDGVTRRFLIDIETDSMIASDEQAEQQAWAQFLEAVSKFLVSWLPMVEQTPELLPVASQLLMSAIRRFKVGRESEAVIEQALDKLEAKPGQPKQPSGEQLKAQADLQKAQAEIMSAKIDASSAAAKAQADIGIAKLKGQLEVQKNQMEMQKMQMEMQLEKQKMQMELHGQQQKHAADLQATQTKAAMDQQNMQMQHKIAMDGAQAQQGLEQQKQAGAQKTLSQQAQMDETKLAASSAMQQFKSSSEKEAAERGHAMRLEEMKTPDAGPEAPKERK